MKNNLPVLVLKNLLILPNQEVKIELNNEQSKCIIDLAIRKYKKEIIVLTPKDQMEELPGVEDLPSVSVIAKIKSSLELPNGHYRVTLRGLFRAKLKNFTNNKLEDNILECKYKKLEIPEFDKVEALAIKKRVLTSTKKYVNNAGDVSNSIVNIIKNIEDLNKLTDLIVSFMPFDFLKKISYVEEINPIVRGMNLLQDLNFELEVIKLDKKLDEKLRIRLENNQKEFILKEKLHEIEEELGTNNQKEKEVNDYLKRLNHLKLSNVKSIEKIKNEIKKYEYMHEASPESANITNYLDWVLSLPWNKKTIDETNLETIKKSLDKTHYGMNMAKDKILEFIAAKKRSNALTSPIICLVGPAGVGKTTLARSISVALNREFYKISVGGLNDSAALNGHRRTYLGASPGKIIEGLRRTESCNPVILIDEVDKMVSDYKGDPASVLLDILDKNQNQTFVDNFIEEPFDLSDVFFILTANNKYNIPTELLDRLEVIEISSYTILEKQEIAKKYILPKIYKEHNITLKNIKFTDNVIKEIIVDYTNEAGLRDLKRIMTSIVRKLIVKDDINNKKIDAKILLDLLGPSEKENLLLESQKSGIVNGLAVSSFGGLVMPIETIYYPGKGNIKITGMLESVMQESVSVAISYLRSNSKIYGLEHLNLYALDVHIHFLDAAIKKDGPSAGISITTSLLSKALDKPIDNKICMTGEITLNGEIRKVGGIKEKVIGAYNAGMKTIFIPASNHNDLELLPKNVLKELNVIEVGNYIQIFNQLFVKCKVKVNKM